MPTLIFEGDSHKDIVKKVEAWLETAREEADLGPADVIKQSAQLTKDALKVLAASAPEPVAQNELVKALTEAGYRATDATSDALVESLEQLQWMTGDGVVKKLSSSGANAMYKMNANIAKQIIRNMSAK